MKYPHLLAISLATAIVGTGKAVRAQDPLSFDLSSAPVATSPDASPTYDVALGEQPSDDKGATTAAPPPILTFVPPDPVSPPSLPHGSSVAAASPPSVPAPASPPPLDHPDDLFAGRSDSLVARVVGAAEGTRAVTGEKTRNYYGHVDPGNGVWNRGSFSYQFGNQDDLSPEEADERQMAKLQRHYHTIQQKAQAYGLEINLAETLNAIDLANQAPLAVTEDGGFVERLVEAKRDKGLTGDSAILEGRVWAFWDPQRGGWDAPGLRAYDDISKQESIRRDQARRMAMIEQALAFYRQERQLAADRSSVDRFPGNLKQSAPRSQPQASQPSSDQIADIIIFHNSDQG